MAEMHAMPRCEWKRVVSTGRGPALKLCVGLFGLMLVAACVASGTGAEKAAGDAASSIGIRGHVGCGPDAKRIERLSITEPGIYENLLIDGEWAASTLVKITA